MIREIAKLLAGTAIALTLALAPLKQTNVFDGSKAFPMIQFVRAKPAAAAGYSIDSISHVANTLSTTNTNAYSFASVSLGTADANRWIVVCVTGTCIVSSRYAAVALNGAPMAFQGGYESNNAHGGIFMMHAPTGTTATIDVQFSDANSGYSEFNCGISVYRLVMSSGARPSRHAVHTPTHASGVLSFSLNTPAGGAVIAMAAAYSGGTTTWSEGTEDVDQNLEGTDYQSTMSKTTTAETPDTFTATCSDTAPGTYDGVAISIEAVEDTRASSITLVNGASDSTNASATAEITMPASTQEDDLVIMACAADGTGDHPYVLEHGWFPLYDDQSNLLAARTYGFRVGPDGIVGPTIKTGTSTTLNDQAYASLAFRGVHDECMDVSPPTIATGSSGMPDPPSITPTTDSCAIVIMGHLDDDLTSHTAPTNYGSVQTATVGSSGSGCSCGIAYRILATAAAEDPGAFGGGGTDNWVAQTFALRPNA